MSVTNDRKRGGEDGIAIVALALSLVVLLIFASFAIDMGGLLNARRQDQSGADVAALGAVQDLLGTPASLIATVDSLASETLGVAPGTINWDGCGTASTTGDPDSVDTKISGLSCITRDALSSRVQVRLPVRTLDGTFSQVIGASLDHSAAAIAGLETVGFGNILPYGVFGGNGGHTCVRSGPGGIDIPPCDGPDSGNFGIIDLGIWASNDCDANPANAKGRQSETTAVGIDHVLSLYNGTPHGSTTVTDTPNCGATPLPNAAGVGPGNSHNETGAGLWSDSGFGPNNDQPARLARSDPRLLSGAGSQATFTGSRTYVLDNNPLWAFIPTSFPAGEDNLPNSCRRNQFDGPTGWLGDRSSISPAIKTYLETKHADLNEQMRLLMERCFFHYRGVSWAGNGQKLDGTASTRATDKALTPRELGWMHGSLRRPSVRSQHRQA